MIIVGTDAIDVPMACQIQRAGHAVMDVDVFEASRQRAQAQGIEAVSSIKEAPEADVVVVMVATPLQALVAEALPQVGGQHWVTMSTVGPQAVREAASLLMAAGAQVVDAPATGGTARASAGELVIFASGASAAITIVEPILKAMGSVSVVGA